MVFGSTNQRGFRSTLDGQSVIVAGPHSRAVAHEMLHEVGFARQRILNTWPVNELHNVWFDRKLSQLGIRDEWIQ